MELTERRRCEKKGEEKGQTEMTQKEKKKRRLFYGKGKFGGGFSFSFFFWGGGGEGEEGILFHMAFEGKPKPPTTTTQKRQDFLRTLQKLRERGGEKMKKNSREVSHPCRDMKA